VSVNTPAEKQESLGLRFLALRELPDTRCLNGLVISMAGDGMPIAARVVLVPMERHKLSDESAALKRRSQSAWELLMIQHSPVYDADIVSQIGDAFVPRKVNYFLELIRNHTNSVLTGRPSEDSTISEKEESVRRFSRIMEESFDTVLSDRYRRFLEATITELENLAKGG
jgi:hypothetical protein